MPPVSAVNNHSVMAGGFALVFMHREFRGRAMNHSARNQGLSESTLSFCQLLMN